METNIYLAEKRPPLYLIVLMALIAVVLALFVHPAIFVISSLCLTIGLLFLRKPFFVLLFLVFSRAGIDKFARQYRLLEDTSLSINLLGILNIALIFLVIFYFLFMKKKIPNQPFWLTFSTFLYVAIITIFISNNRVLSLRGIMQVGSYLAIYLLLVNQLKHPKDLHKLRFAIITSTIIPVVFGIYQFFTGTGNTEISPGINRIMGTFFHPSAFGMYLIILWPLLFFQWYQAKKRFPQLFLTILLLSVTFCLFMTYTRIVWLAFILNVLGVLFIFRRFRLMILIGMIGASLAIISWQPIMARFSEAIRFENGHFVFSELGSVAWRFQQWQIATRLFKENPLLGIGWWTFPDYNVWSSTPHNDYLRLAAETGILGLIFYVVLMLNVIFYLWSARKNMPRFSPLTQQIGIVLLAIFSYILLSLTDNPLGQPEVSWYLWALIALAVGSITHYRQFVTK
ncbi:MAG: O-antigen ligase family protein [Chloroflexi bacterium]|nr:O-antigen ligase family protein [Chloroflexota bacterium]MBP7044945.1 O-antigen ligase family protein [Chloroflexota bacterium]